MNKRAKTIFSSVCFASVLMSASTLTQACDYHNQPSFGAYGNMGNFAQSHPLMQRHISQSKTAQLSLSHARKVLNDVEEQASVDITYHLPENYKNASLRFTHSDGVEIDVKNEVEIDGLDGTYTLNYVPRKPGKQHILVWADATRQTLPFSIVQRIDLEVN